MMATGNITIDTEAVRELVARGIIDAIGPEQRDLVIQQAVQALLEAPKDTYGRVSGDTPLQQAFNNAVRQIATDVVKDYLNVDEVKTQVRQKIVEVVEQLLTEQNWHVSAIGYAFGERLTEMLRNGSENV